MLRRTVYYDRFGDAIGRLEWHALVDDPHYQRLRFDTVGSVDVSTVWLGIDHNFTLAGPPLIFETRIFNSPLADLDRCRYVDEAEALYGHDEIVMLVRMELSLTQEAR